MTTSSVRKIRGRQIRIARVLAGLKQRELAAGLEVPRQRVSEWELEVRQPTASQLDALKKLLSRTLRDAGRA